MVLLKRKIILIVILALLAALLVAAGNCLYSSRKSGRSTTGNENTPDVQNAYLLVNVVDKEGNPVPDCVLSVRIEYDPPNDYANYSYEVELAKATGDMVGLSPGPIGVSSTARITAKCPGGSISQEYSITNAEYWQKVEDSTTGYAEEITFVVVYRIYLPFIIKNYP